MKVETHNAPSALEPYGGAITGIVGVNRDILGTGMGAKPIFNTDVLCFGPRRYKKKLPPNVIPPERIFKEVHRGIKDGSNQSGIPTVNGAMVFDDAYVYRPLVYCGSGGIMPIRVKRKKSYHKKIQVGDLIAMVGGRIGRDGIHGATISSAPLSVDSLSSSVQIADPITQKKMIGYLLEARDQKLFRTLTDNGAGGLSSSVGEMALLVGSNRAFNSLGGCELNLEKAPLKYRGLMPWEIIISEAQERMTLAVPPKNKNKLQALSKKAWRRNKFSRTVY